MDFRGVPPMKMTGNLSENWTFWRQRFRTYLLATEISKKEEIVQCAQLLTLIGEDCVRIYNTFTFTEEEKDKLTTLIDKFDKHFNPKKNLTYQRHKFLTCRQREGETVEQYITELKNLAIGCELGNLQDGLIKDILICGILSEEMREKLLQEDHDSLDDAINKCISMENTKQHSREISNKKDNQIDAVRSNRRFHTDYGNQQMRKKSSKNHNQRKCQKCGQVHGYGKCPAYGKKCSACGNFNHFAQQCRNKISNNVTKNKNYSNKKVECIETNDMYLPANECDDEDNNFLFLGSIDKITLNEVQDNKNMEVHGLHDDKEEAWIIDMEIEGKGLVKMKLDTGAAANIIPLRNLEKIGVDLKQIEKTNTKLTSYTALIEEGYHSTNPYHNSIHATDVTQAMHCFLQEDKIRQYVTPLEIMAALIGAVAHDLDHPGVNQHFLISTSNHLAILYQNKSVLENHHWRSAIGCLLESGVVDRMKPYRDDLEQQIRDLILATDINRQQEFLTKFKKHLDEDTLDLRQPDHRQFILQIALKCADISNPTRPWDISHKWSLKVCDEFFRQGEYERKLNLPVTSICDQQTSSVAKIQVGFFKFVVTPLFSEWHRFLKSTLSSYMMRVLEDNRRRWEAQESAEQAEEVQTELSDAEAEASDEEEPVKRSLETPSIKDFIPSPPREIRRQSLAVPTLESLGVRRHSVPVNMEQSLPRTIYRRESLPIGRGAALGRTPASPQTESRASSGLREEDELLRYGSPLSDVSSGSVHHSSEGYPDRPLSAENLLPEPSIASMTSCSGIGRLTSVLQGNSAPPMKCLTRQQTFPPPQPYVRMRYMSATAEMSACPEIPHEGDSRSNSSQDSHENISISNNNNNNIPHYTIPSIAVLSPNNSRPPDLLLPEAPSSCSSAPQKSSLANNKRETESVDKEKTSKMVKLSEPAQRYEKENVDPRRIATTSLARRRGSAPVTLPLAKPEEKILPAGGGLIPSDTQSLRRGSVPIEIAHYQPIDDENLIEQPLITPVETTKSFWQCQRRGSAPMALPPISGGGGERRELLTRHTSLNGKSGRRKKQLRRRSSGGPETVCFSESPAEVISRLLLHRRPENPEALLVRRRGSLPIEVLTVGHSVF